MIRNALSRCLECELEPLHVKLSDIFDNANDAIIITDLDHKIVGWNKRAEEMVGFKAEELLGKDALLTIVPKRLRRIAGGVTKALNNNGAIREQGAMLTKDGKEVPFRASIRPILDGSGRKVGFLTIAADISEIKRKEERLQRRNRELRAFKEVSSAIGGPMPIKQTLKRAVEAIVKVLHGDAGAIFLLKGSGAAFSTLAHHGASEQLAAKLVSYPSKGSFSACVLESGKGIVIGDTRLPRNKGRVLSAAIEAGFRSFIGVPLVWKKETLGTLEVVSRTPSCFEPRDLRLLMTLGCQVAGAVENALLREKLQESLRSRTRLVAEARHRLSNNLQSIMFLLSSAGGAEQRVGNGKGVIDLAIRRIAGMASIQEQMDSNGFAPIKLSEAMSRIEVCLREIHGDEHAFVLTTKGGGLKLSPSLASSLAISVNELVWNSCVHGFAPGERGRIAVEATVTDGMVKVKVEDNGRGIPEDFDLGRDAHTGLSIVRNLVKRDLEGELTLCRNDGTAATITWASS